MPRITQGFDIGPASPVRAVDARLAQAAGSGPKAAGGAQNGKPLVTSDALDPGEAPVDGDRVTVIRKAIEEGSYPVVPARIADAIIAAGMLLRNPDNG